MHTDSCNDNTDEENMQVVTFFAQFWFKNNLQNFVSDRNRNRDYKHNYYCDCKECIWLLMSRVAISTSNSYDGVDKAAECIISKTSSTNNLVNTKTTHTCMHTVQISTFDYLTISKFTKWIMFLNSMKFAQFFTVWILA